MEFCFFCIVILSSYLPNNFLVVFSAEKIGQVIKIKLIPNTLDRITLLDCD